MLSWLEKSSIYIYIYIYINIFQRSCTLISTTLLSAKRSLVLYITHETYRTELVKETCISAYILAWLRKSYGMMVITWNWKLLKSDIREIEHERGLLNCQEQGPLNIPIKIKYRTQLGQQIMLVFHGPNNFFI